MEEKKNLSSVEEDFRVTEISHETLIKVKQYEFKWKVKNFQHWHWNVENQEIFLCSPEFYTVDKNNEEIEWRLELFPKGFEEEEEDAENYVDVRLSISDESAATEDSLFETDINAQISLLDKHGFETVVRKKTLTNAMLVHHEAIFHKFVHRDLLFGKEKFDETTSLTPNHEITILCRLFFHQGFSHNVVPVESHESNQDRRLLEFDDFKQLLECPDFSDVKLIIGDKEFSAHKNILVARSSVFADMLKAKQDEQQVNKIEINDIDAEVMEEFLRFVYTGKVENIRKLGCELLVAGEKYKLKGLQAICEQVLIDDLNEKNIGDILVLINKCPSVRCLKIAAIEFLTKNAKVLTITENLKNVLHSLSPMLLTEVVKALMLKL